MLCYVNYWEKKHVTTFYWRDVNWRYEASLACKKCPQHIVITNRDHFNINITNLIYAETTLNLIENHRLPFTLSYLKYLKIFKCWTFYYNTPAHITQFPSVAPRILPCVETCPYASVPFPTCGPLPHTQSIPHVDFLQTHSTCEVKIQLIEYL